MIDRRFLMKRGVLNFTKVSESNVERTTDETAFFYEVRRAEVFKGSKRNVDWHASRGQHLRVAPGRQREAPAFPEDERV